LSKCTALTDAGTPKWGLETILKQTEAWIHNASNARAGGYNRAQVRVDTYPLLMWANGSRELLKSRYQEPHQELAELLDTLEDLATTALKEITANEVAVTFSVFESAIHGVMKYVSH
jgi:hypothetical protein